MFENIKYILAKPHYRIALKNIAILKTHQQLSEMRKRKKCESEGNSRSFKINSNLTGFLFFAQLHQFAVYIAVRQCCTRSTLPNILQSFLNRIFCNIVQSLFYCATIYELHIRSEW